MISSTVSSQTSAPQKDRADQVTIVIRPEVKVFTLQGWAGISNGLICALALWIGLEIMPKSGQFSSNGVSLFFDLIAHFAQPIILTIGTLIACLAICFISVRFLEYDLHVHHSRDAIFQRLYKLIIPFLVGAIASIIALIQDPMLVPGLAMVFYGMVLHSGIQNANSKLSLLAFTCIHLGLVGMVFHHLYPVLLFLCFSICTLAYGVLTLTGGSALFRSDD